MRTAPAKPGERPRHPCHQRIGPLSAPISTHRTSRFSLALGATKCSRSTLPASGSGKIPPWCVPRRRSVARFRRSVFPNARCDRMLAKCVFRRLTVARYRSDAFPKGPWTGKAPLSGKISPSCIQNELALARFARYASEKRRKAPFGNASERYLAAKAPFSLRAPLESRMVRKSCHPLMILAFRWRDAFPEGWDAQSLLLRWCEPGRPCLGGGPPVPSLSSGRSPNTAFPGGWRAFTFPLRRIEAGHKKGDPRGSPFCWLGVSRLALAVQAGWSWRCELALTALVPRLLAQVAGRLALAVRPTC